MSEGVAIALRVLSRPPASSVVTGPAIGQDETAATLAALKPPKRQRPVIAVIGINDATETTDYPLSNIKSRYGARTRYVVGMQLEYPRL